MSRPVMFTTQDPIKRPAPAPSTATVATTAMPRSLGSKSRSFMAMTPRNVRSGPGAFADHTQPSQRDHDGQPPHKKFRSSAAPKGTRFAKGYTDRTQERRKEQEAGTVTDIEAGAGGAGSESGRRDGDDKQERLKRLEELLKKEEIDRETFEKQREELGIGGDVESTHLVKGLDFKLLERIRRGEDVSRKASEVVDEVEGDGHEHKNAQASPIDDVDVDDELEKALERNTDAVPSKDGTEANGQLPHSDEGEEQHQSQHHGQSNHGPTTMSRDEILRQLKAQRKAPNSSTREETTRSIRLQPQQSAIDQSRFKKLDPTPKPDKKKFTESINGRRREVLLITKKDGSIKRKTRWIDPEPDPQIKIRDANADSNSTAWGSDLPEQVIARQKAAVEEAENRAREDDENDDGDIFGGVADYDPLAGLDSDGDGDDVEHGQDEDRNEDRPPKPTGQDADPDTHPNPNAASKAKPLKSTSTHLKSDAEPQTQPRNYFTNTSTAQEPDSTATPTYNPRHDPAILAALKRASHLRQQEDAAAADPGRTTNTESRGPSNPEADARNRALLKKLQQNAGQDDVDLDMSFDGDARFDEEEETEDGGKKQRLSLWKGLGAGMGEDGEDDAEGEGDGGGSKDRDKEKKKRTGGGKKGKRKGDKNSFADVMGVLERRKQ